jgi:hypothetical protein
MESPVSKCNSKRHKLDTSIPPPNKAIHGVSAKLMQQLYMAVAIPKMTYGAEVWYTPLIKPIGAARNAGSVGALRGLQKTHRIVILAINGALRTTPTDMLDTHAGTLPIELMLLKTCHRATTRICTLAQTHCYIR